MQRAVEQIIGREGETATFLKTSSVSLTLREFGFAPRQLNRYAASLAIDKTWIVAMTETKFQDEHGNEFQFTRKDSGQGGEVIIIKRD